MSKLTRTRAEAQSHEVYTMAIILTARMTMQVSNGSLHGVSRDAINRLQEWKLTEQRVHALRIALTCPSSMSLHA